MTHSTMPISSFMTSPVVTLPVDASLAEANRTLRERGISCVPVIADGRVVGVVSRTDLLRVGRRAASGARSLLTFPADLTVASVMHPAIVALPPDAAVSAAARTMVQRRIHRVFVLEGDALAGVFSTKDVLAALHEKKARTPIAEVMSAPVFTIPLGAPLALAADRLEKAHVSGLCVVDEDEWPVGTFTQTEALAARDLPPETPLEEVMSYALLCLDERTPLYRAAGHAHATRARRVLAVADRKVRGVITALDFARVAAAG